MDQDWYDYIQHCIANQARKREAFIGSPHSIFWIPELDEYSVRFGTTEYMDKLWLQEIGIKS